MGYYFVNSQKYETRSGLVSGAEIKARIPNVRPPYTLFLDGRGRDADRIVDDTDRFSISTGSRGVLYFYTVPNVRPAELVRAS